MVDFAFDLSKDDVVAKATALESIMLESGESRWPMGKFCRQILLGAALCCSFLAIASNALADANSHSKGQANEPAIAIVVPPYFPLRQATESQGYGGTERDAAALIKGLVQEGRRVRVYAPAGSSVPDGVQLVQYGQAAAGDDGGASFDWSRAEELAAKQYRNLRKRLIADIKRGLVDVVNWHGPLGGAEGLFHSDYGNNDQIFRVPKIISSHNPPARDSLPTERVMRRNNLFLNAISVQHLDDWRRTIGDIGDRVLGHAYNPVDDVISRTLFPNKLKTDFASAGSSKLPREVHDAAEKLKAQLGDSVQEHPIDTVMAAAPFALFLGRKDLHKRPDKAIELVLNARNSGQLPNGLKNLKIVVAGPERNDAETVKYHKQHLDKYKGKQYQDAVIFVDELRTPFKEFVQAITACNLHSADPSKHSEPFGLPPVESGLGGVPTLATKGGALPEIVGKHGGKVVPFDDFDKAVGELRDVLLMDRKGVAKHYARFGIKPVSQKYLELFGKAKAISKKTTARGRRTRQLVHAR